MRFPWPFKRHSRWQEELDAYADGEIDVRGSARLDEHLAACETCRETLAGRQQVKRLAAALPELPAPRSFRITPGMLVEAREPAPVRRGATVVMRLGQATAGVAALAFAAVLVTHISTNGSDGGNQRQAADADIQSFPAANEATASQAAPSASAEYSAPPPQPTPGIPGFSDATVGGASNAPTEVPKGHTERAADQQDPALRDTAQPQAAGDDGVAADAYDSTARADEDDSDTAFVVVEAALGTLAVAALATWLVARRSRSA